ncbi:MAG: CTP-dependent riboflavin kinase [Archaeoglobaceae archaeon]|nr:CTP-dependent riboflavin kinase [Archaeoglobaceae archaeon]
MLEVLKQLALMNASKKVLKISSKELADKINQSLQTAARKLKELESDELIERTLTKDGQFIVITEKGKRRLYREYLDYKKIFEEDETITIKGKVFSGVGEGRYYVSLEGYKERFKEKLGFDPYPGTLNLKIPKEQLYFRRRLEEEDGILIEGFKTPDRTFGDVKAFKCKVNGIEGAIVLPKRTHYPSDVLEVIAPVKLRNYGIKDGDFVEVEVCL